MGIKVKGCALLLLLLSLVATFGRGGTAAQNQSAEVELARKYAPAFFIKTQDAECSADGEPYLPIQVEAVLNDPEVELRRIAEDGESSDPVVMTGPSAQDLAGLGSNYYLDFPGDTRKPGCSYEEWSRERISELGLKPSVYAHIATDPDRPGELALQYWHYWVFNDFNNKHESDWEMVQLNFAASTAEEALKLEPESIAFAQHGGGESADWDDEKLQKDGDRLEVFPAAGSHASYYDPALWLGWGSQGSGFGCDDIREPITRIDPIVVLIPNTIDPEGDFAWLLFDGRWGQRESWEFNGPKGPNTGIKWSEPVGWTDGIRENSLPIPGHSTVGPGPAGVFCSISGSVSNIITIFPADPAIASALSLGMVALLAIPMFLGWKYFGHAIHLYIQNWPMFLVTSALMLPIAGIGRIADDWLANLTPGSGNDAASSFTDIYADSFGIGISGIQQILTFTLIAPIIIYATYDILSDEDNSLRESWSAALRKFRTTLPAVFIPLIITGFLAATAILAPVAIYKSVQWLYTPHAVMIRDATWRDARHVSKSVVKGHWFRTLGFAAGIALFSGVPGPIGGVIALVLGGMSMETANLISTGIYLIAYPIAVIASTLYFLKIAGNVQAIALLEDNGEAADQAVTGEALA